MTRYLSHSSPYGPGRWWLDLPLTGSPTGGSYPAAAHNTLLVLAHGAGRGPDSPDLARLAAELPAHGIGVARHEQPWVLAGRRVAAPPSHLDACLRAGLSALRRCRAARPALPRGSRQPWPVVLGGRSAGARSVCRVAAAVEQPPGWALVGVVLLAFPLHPPGSSSTAAARLDELRTGAAAAPTLVLQGERDTFGSAADVRGGLGSVGGHVVELAGFGHCLAHARTPAAVDPFTTTVLAWLRELHHVIDDDAVSTDSVNPE